METENIILWKSRTSGRKTVTMLMSCLAVLLISLVCLFVFSNENDTFRIIILVFAVLAIIACIVAVCLAKLSDLKWNVSNLIFFLTESGLYFTGVANQESYFYAEWSEIVGYCVTTGENGKATVTVNFNGVADAGSFGKVKYVKMVGVTEVQELCNVFEKFGINQTQLSKNS